MTDIAIRVENLSKSGRTIIRTKPAPSSKEPTPAQQATRERFQEATAYGKGAKDDPAYAKKAAGTPQTTYNPSIVLRAGPSTLRLVSVRLSEVEGLSLALSSIEGNHRAGIAVTAVDRPGGAAQAQQEKTV